MHESNSLRITNSCLTQNSNKSLTHQQVGTHMTHICTIVISLANDDLNNNDKIMNLFICYPLEYGKNNNEQMTSFGDLEICIHVVK